MERFERGDDRVHSLMGASCRLGAVVLVCLGCLVGGCGRIYWHKRYHELMRGDPSELSSSDRAELVRLLLCGIQDGGGRQLKTPWGQTYLDYYMRVLWTLPLASSSSLINLRSCTHMPADRWGNAGEAVVQEGYGQRACEAIMAAAQRWEKEWKAGGYGANVRPADIGFAYKTVIELKFRMFLHENKDILREVALANVAALDWSPRETLSGKAEAEMDLFGTAAWADVVDRHLAGEFQVGNVGYLLWDSLVPKLAAAKDPLFDEAYAGWQRMEEKDR